MTKTAINDLLDWIDRVEERGIKQLSTGKIRERIKERLPIEQRNMLKFQSECAKSSKLPKEVLKEKFN